MYFTLILTDFGWIRLRWVDFLVSNFIFASGFSGISLVADAVAAAVAVVVFKPPLGLLRSLHAALCNCDHMPLCMNECINECLCTVISHNGTCKNNESCQNTLFLNDYCWTRWDLLTNVSPLRAKQLIKPTINYLPITHTGSCCFNLFLFFSFLFFFFWKTKGHGGATEKIKQWKHQKMWRGQRKKQTNPSEKKLASEEKKMLPHQKLKGANQRQRPKAENHLH